jgi:hypothetical protein
MSKWSSFVVSILLGILLALGAKDLAAQAIRPEMIERAKRATALVESAEDHGPVILKVVKNGSAFCIDRSGLFITCASVVTSTNLGISGKIEVHVVLDAGKESARKLRATVLRHDLNLDLALLQVSGDAMPPPLELGREDGLRELLELYTFGYPYDKEPAVGSTEKREISVLRSRVTALRKEKGRLADIAFDKTINPGYWGGPILDESGRVVAVAVYAASGGDQTLAIPVGCLADFLAAPTIVFDVPNIPFETRRQAVTWTIRIEPPTPVSKMPERLTVAATITPNRGTPRTYAAHQVGDGVFQAAVIPDPDVEFGVRDDATKEFKFAAYVPDCDLSVGSKLFRLSDLDLVVGGPSSHVKTTKGQVVQGEIRGLSAATRDDGSYKPVTIDLKQAIELAISHNRRDLTVAVEVRQDSKILGTVSLRKLVNNPVMTPPTSPKPATATAMPASRPSPPPVTRSAPDPDNVLKLGGMISVAGVSAGAGKDIRPPTVALPAARLTPGAGGEAPLVVQLPGTISDVVSGGGGRFLFLNLKNVRKIAVFDVNAAAVVKLISLPTEHALVAAGARKMLVLYPDERLIERYDLATLRRDVAPRPSPIKSPVRRLVMGSDSLGPALAYWLQGGGLYRLSFIELVNLTVPKVGSIGGKGSHASVSESHGSFTSDSSDNEHLCIRASANGSLFALWNPGVSGGTSATLSVHGDAITAAQPSGSSFGQLFPGPDERTIFTGAGIRIDAEGTPFGRTLAHEAPGSGPMLIPTNDPALFLSIGGLPGAAFHLNGHLDAPPKAVTVAIHSAGDGLPLLTVHGLDEMTASGTPEDWHRDDFTAEKRFHFVPAAHLLVTIPPSNDCLMLRGVDIGRARPGESAPDRLTVTSLPNLTVSAGRQLVHRIEARSKNSPITYQLARGPDGLEVDRDGKTTWTPPPALKGRDLTAVIVVGDASGQEIFHTLRIHVD